MTNNLGKIAIVLGATGLIGKALVKQLSQAEHIAKVIAITRKPVEYSHVKVENHIVDFNRLTDFTSSFCGDLLFSCLGTTVKTAGSISAQKLVDVEYQFQAAELAAKNGVKHYLLVSSSGANTKSKQAYFQIKGTLEDKITTLPFERISIFRPSLLKGPRNEFRIGEKFAAPLLSILAILPGLKKYQPISGEMVARKMVNISRHNNGAFELYELGDLFN